MDLWISMLESEEIAIRGFGCLVGGERERQVPERSVVCGSEAEDALIEFWLGCGMTRYDTESTVVHLDHIISHNQ